MIRNFKLHAAHVKKSGSDRCFYMICYSVVVLCLLILLLPMMYVLAASFSSAAAVNAGKVWLWPVDFSLKGYETVLQYKSVWIGYKNTIIYTLCGTLINVAVTMLCAYPLSRKELGGRTFFTFLFSFTMLFSGGLIPTYILIRDLRMINTVWAMLLPGAMSVYNMIIARVFIESSIPGDLLEASRLDGASDAQYFFHVVLLYLFDSLNTSLHVMPCIMRWGTGILFLMLLSTLMTRCCTRCSCFSGIFLYRIILTPRISRILRWQRRYRDWQHS